MRSNLAHRYGFTNSPKPAQLQSHSFLHGLLDKIRVTIYYLTVTLLDSGHSDMSEAKLLILMREILTQFKE